MGENLRFGKTVPAGADQRDATPFSAYRSCYLDNEEICNRYGGHYQWHSAMGLPAGCNSRIAGTAPGCRIETPHRGICPEGWHIPTMKEWRELDEWVDRENDAEFGPFRNDAARSLKTNSPWRMAEDQLGAGGSDRYGWGGAPLGLIFFGGSHALHYAAEWWSATEENHAFPGEKAKYANMSGRSHGFWLEGGCFKARTRLSVRCLKDE